MRQLLLLLGCAIVVAAAGCSDSTDPVVSGDPFAARQLPQDLREYADDVVAGNNTFAFEVYRALREDGQNLFLSPFSISTAFAMLQAGARGNTEAQIAEVFHYPADQARLHEAFHALLVSLNTGAKFDGYRLSLVNRLWGQVGYQFLPEYLDVTREQYLAELEELNFSADPEAARATVNAWVEAQTENLIKDLMPPGSITGVTRLVLTNAIYFKGTWETQFDVDETEDRPFHVTPKQTVTVPTMFREDTVRVGWKDQVAVLELPYAGRDLSMIILLPDALDGLADLEARLSPENLDAWLATLAVRERPVYLPRFKFESKFVLNETLPALGMPDAFDPGRADLSGLNGRLDLFVQAAIHQAWVEVNEEGTEAAAATGISVGETSVPPSFTANHPFVFLIRDHVTGSVLFLGRVVDPSV